MFLRVASFFYTIEAEIPRGRDQGGYFIRFFRLLCEPGSGVCTAEAQRAQSKISKFEFRNSNFL